MWHCPSRPRTRELDGVKEVQSFSQGNAYAVIVEFDDSFSSPEGAAILETANASIDTPDEATITVRPIDATKFLEVYDLLVTVSGPADATAEELEIEGREARDLPRDRRRSRASRRPQSADRGRQPHDR